MQVRVLLPAPFFKAVIAQLVERNLAKVAVVGSNPASRSRIFMTIIKLDSNNRMLRIGFGKNHGRWFARVDLWFIGIRVS